ncbi:MAG: hypothetical protein J3R72DRAFT_433852 [Linnemannia gamsii]|nr:MAG: hypothetical protein J3R72DRAFT_433852 [Linnemannia gamsii]
MPPYSNLHSPPPLHAPSSSSTSTSTSKKSSARTTFFAIPELVQHLGLFLTSQDIVRVRTTCTSLHKAYHHLFWRTVNFSEGNFPDQPHSKSIRLLDSKPGVRAFATHLRYIKSLTCDAYIVSHYALGLCVLLETQENLLQEKSLPSELQFMSESSTEYMQELTTVARDLIATAMPPGQKLPTRPHWVFTSTIGKPYVGIAAPILYTANAGLFFPPMTNLTRLECSFIGIQPQDWWSRPCQYPLSDLTVTATLCWMLYFNKGLEHIKVDGINLAKTKAVKTLAWTLSGLANLKTLDLESQEETSDHVGEFLLFHCSQTLESFYHKADMMSTRTNHQVVITPWYDYTQTEEYFLKDSPQDWVGARYDVTIEIPRKPMPLLKRLRMPDRPRSGFTDELCSVLEHCPALESWHLPRVEHRSHIFDKALNIVKDHRMPLKKLTGDYPKEHEEIHMTPGRILDILEQHTLESFSISFFSESTGLTSKLFQHSATLRDITFDQVKFILSTTIRDILTNCRALEKLVVRMDNVHLDAIEELQSVSLTITHAILKPWVCLGLKHLEIPVELDCFPECSDFTETDSAGWYHDWHQTQDNKAWEALGKFYAQIGALHQLEVLDLKACVVHRGASFPFGTSCYDVSLPGMLLMPAPPPRTSPPSAIEKKRYPVPGFLHLLSGLTNLRELRGSVRMDLPGMVSTMRLDSYRWIGRHWPKLKVAEFLLPGYQTEFVYHLPPHITWLFTERPFLRLSAYKIPPSKVDRKKVPA